MSYLIFDIETIPDLSIWTPPAADDPPADPAAPLVGQLGLVAAAAPAPVGLPGAPPPANAPSNLVGIGGGRGAIVIPPSGGPKPRKSRSKKPKVPGEMPMPPRQACKVIAIGYTWLDLDGAVKQIGCASSRQFANDDEGAMLSAWNNFVRQERPTIVTFNGRAFDVPVMSLRALRLGISQAWADKEYRHRYGDQHMDLMDLLGEYGHVPRDGFSLDMLSQLIGLPGKNGVDSSKVYGLWQKGEHAKIEGYCMCDTVKTAFLLLRYLLMRGRLDTQQYQIAAKKLLDTSASMQLGGVTWGCDVKRLLLE